MTELKIVPNQEPELQLEEQTEQTISRYEYIKMRVEFMNSKKKKEQRLKELEKINLNKGRFKY